MHQVTIGDKWRVTIPKEIREQLGIKPGQRVEVTASGHTIRIEPLDAGGPHARTPVEVYSPERIAEFQLSNAVGADDHAAAVKEVRRMGLDPDAIPHVKPEQ